MLFKNDEASLKLEVFNYEFPADGGDPTIWEHYGDIANAQGLKNEARTGWERALELDHPNPETIRKKLNSL